MALRDKMTASVQPFLMPGEELQAVVGAQTASQFVAAFAGLLFFFSLNRYRILAATSHRILVLDTGKFSTSKARGVVVELPRSTVLGPGSGIWHVVRVGDEKLRIHRRFFKDMAVSDAAVQVA